MDTSESREELSWGISDLAHLSDEGVKTTPLSCIYPSHTVAVQGGSVIWLSLQPLGAGHVRCRSGGALLVNREGASLTDATKEEHRSNTAAFMAEDKVRIEALQQGLQVFEPSQPYCAMERTNWEFGKYLHARLCAGG